MARQVTGSDFSNVVPEARDPRTIAEGLSLWSGKVTA